MSVVTLPGADGLGVSRKERKFGLFEFFANLCVLLCETQDRLIAKLRGQRQPR